MFFIQGSGNVLAIYLVVTKVKRVINRLPASVNVTLLF
jgi:hypothetical protein